MKKLYYLIFFDGQLAYDARPEYESDTLPSDRAAGVTGDTGGTVF